METNIGKSEVARLRQQIEMEYEAAERGLYGFAEGAAQHAFITARMENIGTCFEELQGLVGHNRLFRLWRRHLKRVMGRSRCFWAK